jgi:hypothetical protein
VANACRNESILSRTIRKGIEVEGAHEEEEEEPDTPWPLDHDDVDTTPYPAERPSAAAPMGIVLALPLAPLPFPPAARSFAIMYAAKVAAEDRAEKGTYLRKEDKA